MEATKRILIGKTFDSGQGVIYDEATGRNIAVCYDEDDVEPIVRAVNEYDRLIADKAALVAALEGLLNACHEVRPVSPSVYDASETARAALEAARGGNEH